MKISVYDQAKIPITSSLDPSLKKIFIAEMTEHKLNSIRLMYQFNCNTLLKKDKEY